MRRRSVRRWIVPTPAEFRRAGRSLRGFTLIELLVVISIIALLAGLILPSLAKARAIGKSAACKGNLRSAGTAFRMYLNDSNDFMPIAAASATSNSENRPLLVDVLGQNLSVPEVLLCPDDTDRRIFNVEGSSYIYNINLYDELDPKPLTEIRRVQRNGDTTTIVLNDNNDFKAHEGAGGTNYLYADFHVEE